MSTFIVTVWNIGDVYVGNDPEEARKAQLHHKCRIQEGGGHGDWPVLIYQDGVVIRRSSGVRRNGQRPKWSIPEEHFRREGMKRLGL